MLTTTRLLPDGLLRLILMMLLVLGVSLRPAGAQNDSKKAEKQDEMAQEADGAPAPAASGVLIPLGGGASKSIAVTSATQISHPTLEESNITPVVNKLPTPTAPPIGAPPSAASGQPSGVLSSPPPPAGIGIGLGAPGAGFTESEDVAASATQGGQSATQALQNLEGGETEAPYLRDLKPISIFDAGKSEELTSMQRVAKQMAARKAARERLSLSNIRNLSTYEYEIEGPSEAKIFQEAQTRALLSAAGRLYFEDYLILGLDLLEPYLRENGKGFVARTSVLEHRALSATRTAMRVRVSVNLDTLFKDLQDKHFLAKPNLRPNVGVLLQEIVNGERNTATGGRGRVERTMQENQFQVFTEKIRTPALDSDVSASARLLKEARMEAQRNDIDVLITGALVLQPVKPDQIYYDNYAFKDAEITLKMYRVDTGELISELRDRYSAAAGQEPDATKSVLDAMITRDTQQLADELGKDWANTMHVQENNYRLMISGVNAGDEAGINNALKTLSPKLEIYKKSYLGDVLVLNLAAPGITSEKLEAFLRESNVPQFSVKKVDKRRLILDVL